LTEAAPTLPVSPYGLSKLAQEAVALATARAAGIPVVVTRSFNHTGPGQRPDFVVPALARRVVEAKRTGASAIRVGNAEVRRDFLDVRDVVIAYRLLIEWMVGSRLEPAELVVNVASGRSMSIRDVAGLLIAQAGIDCGMETDPALVRADDPPEIVGSSALLRVIAGWQPTFPLDRTLHDVLRDVDATPESLADPPAR
jgi:GDP-4-dehydro-6-deoxy-D-mannose reductase